MNKVFVFCIGGTGLRVFKSVVMLLASGFKTGGYKVVPIIIDPHQNLDEKKHLDQLIKDYICVYDTIIGKDNSHEPMNPLDGFFSTEILKWQSLDDAQNNISKPMADQRSLKEYLGVDKIPVTDINNFLVKSLLSEDNLNNKLSVGFKGNPNVGTLVLGDMIEGADWYDAFKRHFEQGDKIFIISSIFGGTGAAGYPLLEKKIRAIKENHAISTALMGAITVLPYFSLSDPTTTQSDIDSANFLTKTKAALVYYEKSVKSDYLYYVGDKPIATYENDEKKQKDDAHFIEMVAATALFDFLRREKQNSTQFMSRAIKDDKEVLDRKSLGDDYSQEIKAAADMNLLGLLMKVLKDEKYFPLSQTRGLNKGFYKDEFTKLESFMASYNKWYEDISKNKRGFSPIVISTKGTDADLTKFVKGYSLDAKKDDVYLLDMIKASNKSKETHNNKLRYFLDFAYQAINTQTQKIEIK